MRKILTLSLLVILYSIGATQVKALTKTGCVRDDQGDAYSLTATNPGDRVVWAVSGTTELAVNPGVQWPSKGRYDTVSKKLTITLYNPHPDNCRHFADSVQVVLRYIGNTLFVRNGKGNYFNYCSGGICCNGSIEAAAVQGPCGAIPPPPSSEERGGVGSTSSMPAINVPLPIGVDFNDVLRVNIPKLYVSPNPTSDRAQFTMSLDAPSSIEITIFDQFGRVVRNIASTNMEEGDHTFNWDLSTNSGVAVKDGLYIIVIKTDDNTITNRVMVNR